MGRCEALQRISFSVMRAAERLKYEQFGDLWGAGCRDAIFMHDAICMHESSVMNSCGSLP